MTRDDIIRMAREAGFLCDEDWVTYGLPGFERFAALIAAAEREECAKLCERIKLKGREVFADAIRSRNESQ